MNHICIYTRPSYMIVFPEKNGETYLTILKKEVRKLMRLRKTISSNKTVLRLIGQN